MLQISKMVAIFTDYEIPSVFTEFLQMLCGVLLGESALSFV